MDYIYCEPLVFENLRFLHCCLSSSSANGCLRRVPSTILLASPIQFVSLFPCLRALRQKNKVIERMFCTTVQTLSISLLQTTARVPLLSQQRIRRWIGCCSTLCLPASWMFNSIPIYFLSSRANEICSNFFIFNYLIASKTQTTRTILRVKYSC